LTISSTHISNKGTTMATDKTYKFAGISNHNGEYKVRFANDIMRIKILAKNGHEDIRFFELDEPMTKLAAVQAIAGYDELQDTIAQATINDYLSENAPKTKTVKATGPAATHVHVEQPVEDSELEDAPF